MGRDSIEGKISSLIVALNNKDYQEALKLLREIDSALPKLSKERAFSLYLLLDELSKKLKIEEREILSLLETKSCIKNSYLKHSL
ncbi:hypothetical protein [Thermovibrio sp.]